MDERVGGEREREGVRDERVGREKGSERGSGDGGRIRREGGRE